MPAEDAPGPASGSVQDRDTRARPRSRGERCGLSCRRSVHSVRVVTRASERGTPLALGAHCVAHDRTSGRAGGIMLGRGGWRHVCARPPGDARVEPAIDGAGNSPLHAAGLRGLGLRPDGQRQLLRLQRLSRRRVGQLLLRAQRRGQADGEALHPRPGVLGRRPARPAHQPRLRVRGVGAVSEPQAARGQGARAVRALLGDLRRGNAAALLPAAAVLRGHPRPDPEGVPRRRRHRRAAASARAGSCSTTPSAARSSSSRSSSTASPARIPRPGCRCSRRRRSRWSART